MAEKDLFAPPTKKELEETKLFLPPTEEEKAMLKLKDFGDMTMEAGVDLFNKAQQVIDYPVGIVRTGVDALADVVTGKSGPLAAGEKVIDSIIDPSTAPTAQELAERAGVSDLPMQSGQFKPFGDIPQSAIIGAGIDMLAGIPAAKGVATIGKGIAKGARSFLGGDDSTLRALAIRPRDIEKDIRISDLGTEVVKKDNLVKYAKENVLGKFDSTDGLLDKVKKRLEAVGQQIGEIRKNSEKPVDLYLTKKAGYQELNEYLSNVFRPKLANGRIRDAVMNEIPDPDYANRVLSIVETKIGGLADRYGDNAIPIEKLSQLKANWQRELNFGKEAADYSIREDAFKYLTQDLNKAIDNEIALFDKALSGSQLAKHNKLKKEYSMLKLMNDSLSKRSAKEATGAFNVNPVSGFLNSTRAQTAISSLPDNKVLSPKTTAIGAGIYGAGRLADMREGQYNEPKLQGFPSSQTTPVDFTQYAEIKKQIEDNPTMSRVEKANRLNLLNKYSRIYIGQ